MKVIILEDEKLAMKRLVRMLKELRPDIEIIAELNSIQEADDYFSNNVTSNSEVLFFDIQLGDGQSFELFDRFNIQGILIFTTAYDQYALNAFKVKALDYLLKPVKQIELDNLLNRIELILAKDVLTTRDSIADTVDLKPMRFLIRMGKSLKIINQDEIAYFYSNQKLTVIITWDGKRYPVDESLNKLEGMAAKELFFRLNRKLIVHIKSILDMQIYSKSRIKIILRPNLGEAVLVSTEKTTHFKKWLEGEKI